MLNNKKPNFGGYTFCHNCINYISIVSIISMFNKLVNVQGPRVMFAPERAIFKRYIEL